MKTVRNCINYKNMGKYLNSRTEFIVRPNEKMEPGIGKKSVTPSLNFSVYFFMYVYFFSLYSWALFASHCTWPERSTSLILNGHDISILKLDWVWLRLCLNSEILGKIMLLAKLRSGAYCQNIWLWEFGNNHITATGGLWVVGNFQRKGKVRLAKTTKLDAIYGETNKN
jgi:hypothetical protein